MINSNFILATTVHLYIVYLAIPCEDHFVSLHMFIRTLASTCTNTCVHAWTSSVVLDIDPQIVY